MKKELSLTIVWSKKDYRPLLLIMLLGGMAVSSGVPLISLFLIKDLEVDMSIAGLFFLTSFPGMLITLYTGRLSDRISSRIPLLQVSSLWLALGWGLMSLSKNSFMVFLIGIVFLSFMGTLNSQAFGVLRDIINDNQESNQATITSTIRSAYSFGWTLGPVISSFIASLAGFRVAFLVPVALFLLIVVSLNTVQIPLNKERITKLDQTSLKSRSPKNLTLMCFGVICSLVMIGEAIRVAYLPILAVDNLNLSMIQFGLLVSLAPLTEIVVMPLAGALADKIGINKVIFGGIFMAVVAYLLFASSHPWLLYLGQIMHACFIAIFIGLGVTYIQQLSPNNIGLASSVFFSAQSLSYITGSLIGSYGVQLVGTSFLFIIPSIICAISLILFIINDRINKRMQQPISSGNQSV